MKKFPINQDKLRGLPINAHPGSFGHTRKYNFHEGIDLYGEPGDTVYAIRNGVVISNCTFTGPAEGHPWWLDTDAVLVKDEHGYYVYGELRSNLKPGDLVSAGDIIGKLTPVLTDDKFRSDIPGHSTTMLHLERWNSSYDPNSGWMAWNTRLERPKYLEDPTPELINILNQQHIQFKFLTI